MLKNKAVLEVKIEDKLYEFHCDADSPLGRIHDAMMMMKGWVVDRMAAAHKEEYEAAEKMKQIEEEQQKEAEQELKVVEASE